MTRRVAVTGIGVVTSLGTNTEQFWANCLAGETSVEKIPESWREFAEYHSTLWSPLTVDYAALEVSRVEAAQNDPVSLIAVYAARQALISSGFTLAVKDKRARTETVTEIAPARAGVYMGTGVGGAKSFLENHTYQTLARQKARLVGVREALKKNSPERGELEAVMERLVLGQRFNPFVVSMLMPNAVSALMGVRFSFNGPNLTYALACASGTVAIGKAFDALRRGEVDLALAGGSEYLDDRFGGIFLGFDIAGALVRQCSDPDKANRPFDADRSGFLFSQGAAAVLVLEPLDAARERGATVLAEVAGYAESFDAYSMMRIEPEAREIERMIMCALADANLRPDEIQYVNSHGTGTQANDLTEAQVIERVFGREVLVNSTKSLLGHSIGASGAIEAAVTALSLYHQTTHACRNLENPIAELNFVSKVEQHDIPAAFSQSFAFGGHNAGLVFRRLGD